MRKYEAAWTKLKSEHRIKIAAHPSVHARIIKAVRKEKDLDILYKLSTDEEQGKRAFMHYSRQAGQITIWLTFAFSRISRSDL